MSRNKPWFVSGFSSAAGIIVEFNPKDGYVSSLVAFSGKFPDFNLRGFAISGSTAVGVSTKSIKLRHGQSSDATLTTIVVCGEPGASIFSVSNLLGLEAGYFALVSTVVHAQGGLTAMLWGD